MNTTKRSLALFFLVLISSQTCNGMNWTRVNEFASSAVKNVTSFSKDCLLAYSIGMAITTAHEVGHALMLKILFGQPFHVNIGGYNNRKPLLKLPGLTVCGLNPAIGYTEIDLAKQQSAYASNPQSSCLKRIAVNLAGPLFGTLASIASLTLLNKYHPNTLKPLSIGYPISKLVSAFAIYNNTATQIIPDRAGRNDGAHAYQALRDYIWLCR
ncbi:MAG: hypothetical protein NTX86_04240 [Candidatus Dependentiae bacterium]|nr:hypothetical protein [Candidatus Dependentiae bacterium]